MTAALTRLRIAVVVLVAVGVVAAAVGVWGQWSSRGSGADDAAVTAASRTVTELLTPDPRNPQGYLDAVADAVTGPQAQRLTHGRAEILDYVRGLEVRPAGLVVTAGVQSTAGDSVQVLLVAQASDPTLVGGDPRSDRITLRVEMTAHDGRWLVSDVEPLS